MDRLPRYCDARKVRCDDDVDDLTFKLSQLRAQDATAQAAVSDVFGFLLHASPAHLAPEPPARAKHSRHGAHAGGRRRAANALTQEPGTGPALLRA
jgi:hypothetical protein